MKCLLTGCNGFIAKNFIHYFKEFEITGIDLQPSEYVTTLVQNVSDPIAGEFDLVVHAASGFLDDVEMFNSNFLGTKRCIEVARRNNSPLLFISSAEAYHPVRTYGILKLAGEHLVRTYSKGFIVRPFHIYGPRMNLADGRIQSEIIRALRDREMLAMRGDGAAIRNFTHVSDLFAAFQIILRSGSPGVVYDISNESESMSIIDLLEKLHIPYRKGSQSHPIKENRGDSSLLKALGWFPKVQTIKGFHDTSEELY